VRFVAEHPYSDPEVAMKKLLEIANSVEAIQDGRIHIEKINGPFLFEHGALPAWGRANAAPFDSGGHSQIQNRPLIVCTRLWALANT
jgi:hypothetical protein